MSSDQHPVLQLQRTAGNAAVTAVIQRHAVGLEGWDEIEPLSLQRQLLHQVQRFKGGDKIPAMETVGANRFERGIEALDKDIGGRLSAWMAQHDTDDLFALRAIDAGDDVKKVATRLIQAAPDRADAASFANGYRSTLGLLDKKLKTALASPAIDDADLGGWVTSVLSTIRKRGHPDDLARLDELDKAPDWKAKSAVAEAWYTEMAAAAGAVGRLMNDIASSMRDAAIPEAKQLSPQLRAYASRVAKEKGVARFSDLADNAKKDVIAEAGREWAATEAVEAKARERHFATLTKKDLLKLPTIASIYNAKGAFKTDRGVYERMAKQRAKAGVAIDAHWNDPVVKESDGQLEGGKLAPDFKKNVTAAPAAAKEKVKAAWTRVQAFVEPEVLAKIAPPEVFFIRPIGEATQRAAHYPPSGPIAVDAAVTVPVVAHETGHHLEQIGSGEAWATQQGLAYGRLDTLKAEGARTKKGKGGAAGEPTLTNIPEQEADEVAFPVASPAEGAIDGSKFKNASYTFKYYAHSGAGGEVISMALQWLADPGTCVKFVDKDPAHAASVLFHVIPKEFESAGLSPPPPVRPRADAVVGPVDPRTLAE